MAIELANRTQIKKSVIVEIRGSIPSVNQERQAINLSTIIDLSIGQPHLPINPSVVNALKEFSQNEDLSTCFCYSQSVGRLKTLQAIAKLYQHYYPKVKPYTDKEVMITNGASQALMNAFNILLNPGDIALVFEPYFSTYRSQIESLGAKIITIDTMSNKFRPSGKLLRGKLIDNPTTKLVLLNYPNNPSGVCLSRKEIEDLVCVLNDFPDIAIVIDDVYRELCNDRLISIVDVDPSLKERCIIINSGSKGLAGGPDLRIGMAGANVAWLAAMADQQINAVCSISYISQFVLVKIIEAKLVNDSMYLGWLLKARSIYQKNVNYMQKALIAAGIHHIIPSKGGFFLLVNVKNIYSKTIPNSVSLQSINGDSVEISDLQKKLGKKTFEDDCIIAKYLLYVAGVVIVPGSGFGIDRKACYLRFSCAGNDETLQQAVNQIQIAVEAVKNINY